MKDEYIRKQDALDAFGLSEKTRKYCGDHSGYDTRMLYEIQDTIESLEPADVVPVIHGRWIEDEGEGYNGIHCSRCNFSIPYGNVMMGYIFCPKCGAIMDARGEE